MSDPTIRGDRPHHGRPRRRLQRLVVALITSLSVVGPGSGPDQFYCTASHTDAGPGGWGDHPLEMLVAGAYDRAYFETLAGQLADAVRRSRSRTEPAELGFVRVEAPGRQRNRVDP